jgi:hypothetical protein
MTTILNQEHSTNWSLYNADCVELMSEMEDESIDYSIFSPPFAALYTFSDDPQDMSNCKSENEFYEQFKFMVNELFRISKSGRLVSFHCMQLTATNTTDGYIGLKDFRGDLVRIFQNAGFIYHSEVAIWKDPLLSAIRSKTHGLMHKQIVKDSAMCRQGLPDYVVTMRKTGDKGRRQRAGEKCPNESKGYELFQFEGKTVAFDKKTMEIIKNEDGTVKMFDQKEEKTLDLAYTKEGKVQIKKVGI